MKLFMILIVQIFSTPSTVIYEFNANSQINDGWAIRDNDCFFYNCGGINYFGQPLNDDNPIWISRLFSNLKAHSHIQVEAKVLRIYTSDPFGVDLDYIVAQKSITSSSSSSAVCSGSYVLSITTTPIKHNRRTLWIKAYFFNAGGLMSLKISMINCEYDCIGCIENYKIFCLSWKLHQYSFGEKLITNSDGWIFQPTFSSDFDCGYCNYLYFFETNYSTQLPTHQNLLIRFYKGNTIIIVDYVYGKKTFSFNSQLVEILIENHLDPILLLNIKSQPSTDRGQIRDFELYYTQPEIPIPINKLNEGCLEQIDTKCLICQEGWIYDQFLENCHPICGDKGQLYQTRNFEVSEIIINKFNEGCLEQIETRCLICKEGWIQDQFFENCRPICGDGVIQGQEKCDDANLISNDSCYQCEYSCINFCKTCEFGICFECIFGYDLNADFDCVPMCGDGNVIPYSAEQCDLTDDGKWDNCQDCLYILIADCKNQLLSMCLECKVGFQLLENACFPNCGDKFILQQYEECDDGNLQPYDGCFQCKFQCSEDCNICDKGQCILKCEDGYKFVNNNCLSVCGDQIVTKEEDCDDGNTIQFDGCFNCMYSYSCPENCYDCYQGTCLECNDKYQLLNSNQCKLQLDCGDGYLQKQEECDDGNYEALDGFGYAPRQQKLLLANVHFPNLQNQQLHISI
ncbi:unnamed protein product [Paramecium octaurelia]|uniref:Insulin-like growth factor binding protein, N-terminal n=1 Tax=Paramecium octaurelia TaxID=43137 RepID=A0A8S1SEE3_PAROT|nr:unnamed protein product [Paramecium octaurelia]